MVEVLKKTENRPLSLVDTYFEDSYTYTYGDSECGDLLTAYRGTTITYDQIGNPLSDGEWTYTWEHGRELASISDGETTWTYAYDANGMRTQRTNGTTTYKYYYNGSQLSRMTFGNTTLDFTYDANGIPLTITRNGEVYYYVTNLQGDVVGILNDSGTLVADYVYDAWGNFQSNGSEDIDLYNPLTYRGYVYDRETGLYYLQSRYYNPKWGRFINADGVTSTGQGFLGNNMFAYCLNNPVCYYDPSGTSCICLSRRVHPRHRCSSNSPESTQPIKTDGHFSKNDLTDQQMHENAEIIHDHLVDAGWSLNSISAVLGNMQHESVTINPGRTQDGGGGYGLVQWDPASKYLDWAACNDFSEASLIGQVEYLMYSMQPGMGEWFPYGNHCYLSSASFISSNASVAYLTEVFMWSYERPGVAHLDRRIAYAEYWYRYFS